MSELLLTKAFLSLDHQAGRYCNCSSTWQTTTSDYANYGLCAYTFPKEVEPSSTRYGEKLCQTFLGRVFQGIINFFRSKLQN